MINTDDVDDHSDKTPVGDGGEGIISEGQTIPDVDDNGDKEMSAGGAVRYTVRTVDADGAKSNDVDDNSDNKPGAGGADISKYIPEDDNNDNVKKPMDVTSADEPTETHDGGKNSKNEDSGTSDSKSDSESSDSNSTSSGSSEFESGSENKSSGKSSKSSKVGSKKNKVHDNKTVACNIASEQKESAEVPAKEIDDETLPQHGDEDVSDPGDDLLLEKLMRETDQLEKQPPIPRSKVERQSKHRHLVTPSKIFTCS